MRYQHAGGAKPTTLTQAVNDVVLGDFFINDATGWPDGSVGPFFAVLDRGLLTEEKVLVQDRVGTTLNVIERGADGTLVSAHADGATVEHTFSALEADDANAHIEEVTGIHGLSGAETVASEQFVEALVQATSEAERPQTFADQEAQTTGTGGPTLTTTVHGLPKPDSTDDYRVLTAIAQLADSVDSAVTLILSGTAAPPDPTSLPEGTVYFRTEA